ncbi:bifunctional ornithine acetyltransferase/N-acetylglutamate synthase [Staphylococcus sp. 18_1_E_LY]|uniref:Arginine biosynthesis bifunctional protein ArgJ n=1 Tax=Staphylococcus lloydii TaxID=2781774 RepID=A0A7T1F9P8_9STAP|nr:bifunctional ornithine acetyltransferase/N-acetylglutamate synthase [Staphylococcus lloydii]MBF7020154.1 bifunctional ornithine acetyltransferase/N-acetylglutamate synthase [Staphylococcus lloydii]MBF7027837.1 bifunctional ornithine acetyltransferase/N-acetylglutamate synthase [Staphylococcus lloydii]QPM75510.1 bifunctional ornithine acetyltransferase/N-acetylglutamate synthase [Staphylococcus lloydii]
MQDIQKIDEESKFKIDESGDVSSPLGFISGGLHTGLRKSKHDFGWIYSTTEAQAAGVYTLNRFKAAPLQLTQDSIAVNHTLQAIAVNSAYANACTGEQGMKDAQDMQNWVATKLNIAKHNVGVASTGVIGDCLPMDKIQYGADHVLEEQYNVSENFNKAILTTDLFPKHVAVEVDIDGQKVTIGGTAKGSGMIHPNMATMLGFITTDANIAASKLQQVLKSAIDASFNMITVDGDCSTNDMVLFMANGQVNHNELDDKHPNWEAFVAAVQYVCSTLAKSIAKDGEGATKLVTSKVTGAENIDEARKIAKSIVSSNLVKTAIHGEDANFGRIVAAIGYASEMVNPNDTFVTLCGLPVVDKGVFLSFDEEEMKKRLREDNIVISAQVGNGEGQAVAYGCDLSYDYVRINASYRT